MGLLAEIREKVAGGLFEFSKHAADQTLRRGIRVQEVREAIASGEVIEDYFLGFTQARRPLHVQCSYPSRLLIKIITAYEPDPDSWIDLKKRRSNRGD